MAFVIYCLANIESSEQRQRYHARDLHGKRVETYQ